MEKSHHQRLRERFPDAIAGRAVVTLHIPDDYEFMSEELIETLRAAVEPHLVGPPSA
jgi:protein-tyrosine phosphatase